MSALLHVVVAYDVAADSRRRRVAAALSARIDRVQASVFEGRISERALVELEFALAQIIDPAEDSVRIMRLCARCREVTTVQGWGPILFGDPEDLIL